MGATTTGDQGYRAFREMVVIDLERFEVVIGGATYTRIGDHLWRARIGSHECIVDTPEIIAWLDAIHAVHFPPINGVSRERHVTFAPTPCGWASLPIDADATPGDDTDPTPAHGITIGGAAAATSATSDAR